MPTNLLALPADEAVRHIVLRQLRKADKAARRIGAKDPGLHNSALHDFRVALRRLRSSYRAHGPFLPEAKSRRRALTELQRKTGDARDTEVMLQWLELWRPLEGAPELAAWELALAPLRRRQHKASTKELLKCRKAHKKLAKKLRREVGVFEVELGADRVAFRVALAGLFRARLAELVALLEAAASVAEEEPLHDARLAAKRLRYLLRPVRKEWPECQALLRRLQGMQRLLGDIQDMHVLRDYLRQQRTDDAGWSVLLGRCDALAQERFDALRATYLGEGNDGLRQLSEDGEALAGSLDGTGDREVERKYLLSGLPEHLPPGALKEMVQGYVPGTKIHERLRKTTSDEGVRYRRTVKLGAGVSRQEFEEEADATLFETMWPLTEGRRVHKRRHVIGDGALVWELDVFLDRELFLVEVELSDEHQQVRFPDWLAPYVVREVTGESAYVNLNLAK